jgi:hypothetical protein
MYQVPTLTYTITLSDCTQFFQYALGHCNLCAELLQLLSPPPEGQEVPTALVEVPGEFFGVETLSCYPDSFRPAKSRFNEWPRPSSPGKKL